MARAVRTIIEEPERVEFFFPNEHGVYPSYSARNARRVRITPMSTQTVWRLQFERYGASTGYSWSNSRSIITRGDMFEMMTLAARAIKEDKLLSSWSKG